MVKIGSLIFGKSITVGNDNSKFTFKLKSGHEAVSVLLGVFSKDKPFTEYEEQRSMRLIGHIGFSDLIDYLPQEIIEEIELAEREKYGLI